MSLDEMSLGATLGRLMSLTQWLTPFNYQNHIAEIRDIIQLLEYHAASKEGHQYVEPFCGPLVGCQAGNCARTWRDPDACLLFLNGKWLCRDHHPPLSDGGIHPPGYQPPAAELATLEEGRKAVRAKLTREEQRLINTRIGG